MRCMNVPSGDNIVKALKNDKVDGQFGVQKQ